MTEQELSWRRVDSGWQQGEVLPNMYRLDYYLTREKVYKN